MQESSDGNYSDPNVREIPNDTSSDLWEHIGEVLAHSRTPSVWQARTTLSVACENRHAADIVRLLLDKGADLKADEASRQPALPIAARKGDVATVRILLEHGANINIRDEQSTSVLQNAVGSDNPDLVPLLLDKGVKVEGINRGPTRLYKNQEKIRQMIEDAIRPTHPTIPPSHVGVESLP